MMQRFWILLIKILVLEFYVFKANAIVSGSLQPPSDVRLISINTSTLQLHWSPPIATNETVTGYNITWDEGATLVDNSSTAFDITNLSTPGKAYTAAISAYYDDQRMSEYVNASNNTFPSAPYNLTAAERGTNWLNITFERQGVWDSCDVLTENATESNGSCLPGSNTAVINNLPVAGQEYTIHIVGKSGSLTSSDATTVQRTVPMPASDVTVVSRQTNRFDLNWTSSGDFTGCVVRVEQENAATACFIGNKTAVIDKLSTAGKQYTIHIVIQSGELNSTDANITERTNPPKPGPLLCSSMTNASLTIGIAPPSGYFELDGYAVSISSVIGSSLNITVGINATTTEPNVTLSEIGLTAGVTYSITAKTRIEELISSEDSSSTCTTNLNAPDDVLVSNTTETIIEIKWNGPQGNFDGFNASCDGQNQAKDAFSVRYKSQGSSSNAFDAVCNGLTAGALYNVTVSTFLNQTALTPAKPSDLVQNVTVPMPPQSVTGSPIDTNSIQMMLVYGYNASVSLCTFYEIQYSARTEFVAYSSNPVSHSLLSLQSSDSLYNISTYALSNYSASMTSISRTAFITSAWTLALSVANITGGESLPWSLKVIIGHQQSHKNVWQYVIEVTNSTPSVQRVRITCSDMSKVTLTAVNCVWSDTLLEMNSTAACSSGFSYNITGLRPYTIYNISIQAVNPGGCSVPESIVLQTDESTPLCLNIANTTVNITTIDVIWSTPSEPNGLITGYQITYIQEDPDLNDTMPYITHANETSITLVGLDAYFNYTIKVAAVNNAGVGTYAGCANSIVTAQTRIGSPFAPNLTATPLSPFSALISWTLSRDLRTGPETYYNLTITDTRDPSIIFTEHVEGFYNRSVEVSGLDAYWNYSVAIVAYVIDENEEELATNGSDVYFQTLPSTPGPVSAFNVSSLSNYQQCFNATIFWKAPIERDSNGIITQYAIKWQQLGGADNGNGMASDNLRQTTVRVIPDNQQYVFTIHAVNEMGAGVASSRILQSTGFCLPVQVQNGSSVIMKSDSGDEHSTANSFPVDYDLDFFQFNDNGEIIQSGLIVREVADNENVTEMSETSGQYLLNDTLTWSAAINHIKIPEYRATTDNWLSDSMNVKRKKRSSMPKYVIGANSSCPKDSNAACNGPLPPDRTYKVRAIICTGGGCYKTEYSSYIYRTKPKSSNAWIAAAVIVPIVCIVAVVLILLYIWRKRNNDGKMKSNENEIQSIGLGAGGGNHQRYRITSRSIALATFKQQVADMHRDSDLLFSDEYKEIQESSPKYPWTEAEGQSVKAKNRFINILPFDKTRVRLENSKTGSDYINANYVLNGTGEREYIASQGPLQTTLDDFWQMTWQERSTVIVMLTNLRENARIKCEQYWPMTLSETVQFGIVSVTMTHEQDYTSYVVRHFTAKVKSETRQLTQFHFVAWPDFGVPAQSQLLVDFIKVVRRCIGQQIEPPTIVHCSAGVGRTGTFIALDRLMRLVNYASSIDIFGTVLHLREYRCQMVQTEAQYIFIHDCMSLEIERLQHTESPYEGVYNEAYDETAEPLYANGNQIMQAQNGRKSFA